MQKQRRSAAKNGVVGLVSRVAECDDAATPSPQKTALRPDLEGAGGAADADEAVDGMNVFSELINVLGSDRALATPRRTVPVKD